MNNRRPLLVLGSGLDLLHSFLLSQTTASSRSFPSSLLLSLPLPLSPISRPQCPGSFPLKSISVPGHQPSGQMTPGPTPSTTNLLSPSGTRSGVQAALAQGPMGIKHMSSSSSIVRVLSPVFRPPAVTGFRWSPGARRRDHSCAMYFVLSLVHRNGVRQGP